MKLQILRIGHKCYFDETDTCFTISVRVKTMFFLNSIFLFHVLYFNDFQSFAHHITNLLDWYHPDCFYRDRIIPETVPRDE